MKHSAINAIMRKSAIILLMFYGTLSVSAQYYMNVFRKDGTKIQYLISDLDSMSIAEKPAPINYEYVDLGLSVNWATFNVGATKPEEYGDYYAWGETETKPVYDWPTYKFFEKIDVDDKGQLILNPYDSTNLHSKDDVASVKWGGNWRMPAKEEYDELIENCTWTFIKQNEVYGYKVTSNLPGYEGNSIFIPASGYRDGEYPLGSDLLGVDTVCLYWSSTISDRGVLGYDAYNTRNAYCLLFFVADYDYDSLFGHTVDYFNSCCGLSVRPVCPSDEWLNNLSLTLDKTKESVIPYSVFTLNATAKNGSQDAGKFVKWSSDNPAVAAVNEEGVVTCLSVGTAVIKAYVRDVTATCIVTVREPRLVAEAVDLGLSVKWATCNVGAEKPEDYGGYYAWGETETKSYYAFTNYKFRLSGNDTFDDARYSKYNKNEKFGIVDNKIILDPEDDVARIKWGENWRMPTKDEFNELIDNCTWTWTDYNGVNGYKITSNITNHTDQYIFLPAADLFYFSSYGVDDSRGYYWSSSLYDGSDYLEENDPYAASSLIFPFYDGYGDYFEKTVESFTRNAGLSVRPVCPSEEWLSSVSISFDEDDKTMLIGGNTMLDVIVKQNGEVLDNPPVIWYSDDPSVAVVDVSGNIIAKSAGIAHITASVQSLSAQCTITVIQESEVVHQYVDLGLSVKWATFNLGATKPEEYGDYYAWGETEYYYEAGYAQDNPQFKWKDGKENGYAWSSYRWFDNSSGTFIKYNSNSDCGLVDQRMIIDLEDDVAHVKWGGNWRMPTMAEWEELRDNCKWEWYDWDDLGFGGIAGYKVTSNVEDYTDRFIFLPASGVRADGNLGEFGTGGYGGYYWSSSLCTNPDYPSYAYYFSFSSSYYHFVLCERYWGTSIRPVYPKK